MAAPRSLPGAGFLEHLLRLNGLDAAGFAGWELRPGMRFGQSAAWWRAGAQRDRPHEGLDLRSFRARGGGVGTLGPGTRVPVLWKGTVARIVPDFLGASVFVAHGSRDGAGRRLYSCYGHLDPVAGLARGSRLADGAEVGTIADAARKSATVPSHLHLTVGWIAGAPETLDWDALRDPARAVLFDPLPLVCGTIPDPRRD